MMIPYLRRSSGIKPILLADRPDYTWGVGPKPQKAAERHAEYVELVERCVKATANPSVAAVLQFLHRLDPALTPVPAEMKEGDRITFEVAGHNPISDPDVQAFWAAEAAGDREPGQCLLCGEHTQICRLFPIGLVGLPDAAGRALAKRFTLVSADEQAYDFHGQSSGRVSPLCLRCAETSANALNTLLRHRHRSVRIGPVAYVFWSPGSDRRVRRAFRDPNPGLVRRLLRSWETGPGSGAAARMPFYAFAMGINSSRVVVRSRYQGTIGEAERALGRWFSWLDIEPDWRPGGRRLTMSTETLVRSVYPPRDPDTGKEAEVPARVPEALIQSALTSAPLPDWLLDQAVQRNRAERDVTYPRAALIKAVLCSQQQKELEDMEQLRGDPASPAYYCGCLLAVVEAVQNAQRHVGHGEPNDGITVVDQYYGSLSTTPEYTYPVLMRLNEALLGQLRRNNPKLYDRLRRELEEVVSQLGGRVPTVLNLSEQGLFSLGFYRWRRRLRYRYKSSVADPSEPAGEEAGVADADDEAQTELALDEEEEGTDE